MKFSQAAVSAFGFLGGWQFRLVETTDESVRFESPPAVVVVSYYPREAQVDVTVSPIVQGDRHDSLVISGMVGRASPERLLELAAEKLSANELALRGDTEYFTRVGDEQRRLGAEWTAFYEGKAPQPRGKLP